ncbi:hypothetical protein [Kocuria sp. ZOR0020]|uniref:hypothetical protein n=1 Tax=Kocuria sp. ZOR0020 TaxID=1339234 RepID=UPI000647C55D|nr:hypothetical protein [Kocuria sp. ZOR0020]
MDQGLATTIAAGIAALVSVVTLVVTAVMDRQASAKAAHREIVAPYLVELSEDIYTILASIDVMEKRSTLGQSVVEWQEKAKTAGQRVDGTRRRIRYFLPGVDDALRELRTAADHMATVVNIEGTYSGKLLAKYSGLAASVNAAIRVSYRTGAPPSWLRRRILVWKAKRISDFWVERPKKKSA